MKQTDNVSKMKSNLRRRGLIIITAVFVVGIGLLTAWFVNSSRNYAQEIAQPLVNALEANGAIKKCEQGDNGRSISNRVPHYSATFESTLTVEQAEKMLMKIASENDYSLHEEIAPDGKTRSLTDSSRKVSYSDLVEGNANINLRATGDAADLGCFNGTNVEYGNEHAAIILNVTLPDVKR